MYNDMLMFYQKGFVCFFQLFHCATVKAARTKSCDMYVMVQMYVITSITFIVFLVYSITILQIQLDEMISYTCCHFYNQRVTNGYYE